MLRARRLVVALAAACVAAGVVGPQARANNPDLAVQFIRGQGSDSTYDVMQKLDFLYNNSVGCDTAGSNKPLNSTCATPQPAGIPTTENYDHDIAISFNPVGSGTGIKILDQFGQPGVTRIDYARSSRVRKGVPPGGGTDPEANLDFVAYAQDGLTWGTFRTGPNDTVPCASSGAGASMQCSPTKGINPGPDHVFGTADDIAYDINNLSQAQLQSIFVAPCATTFWDQINSNAPHVPINPWTLQTGSGTRTSFDGFLTASGSHSVDCLPGTASDGDLANGERVIFENNPTPIVNCATPAGNYTPTADSSSGTFTIPLASANKGFVNDQQVVAKNGTGTLPGGLTDGTTYFVVSAVAPGSSTPGTFKLSATQGGAAIALTNNGTGSFTVGAPSCNAATVQIGTTDGTTPNMVTFPGKLLAIFPMSYSAFFGWPAPPGTEKAKGLDLGSIDGKPVSNADGTLNANGPNAFPWLRNFFNVYRKSYATSNVPGATYDYISEEGWICRENAFHATDPKTGVNYADEIANVLISTGLAPLPFSVQPTPGGNENIRCLSK